MDHLVHFLRVEIEVLMHDVNGAQQESQIEVGNRRMKQLLAEQSLDREAPKAVIQQNDWNSPASEVRSPWHPSLSSNVS